MKAKEIKELITFIAASGLDQVRIETDEIKLEIKRHAFADQAHRTQALGVMPSDPSPPVAPAPIATEINREVIPTVARDAGVQEDSVASDSSGYETIKSPMIGTLYESSGPDVAPFVKVGDTIKKGQVLCIIEAMKLF